MVVKSKVLTNNELKRLLEDDEASYLLLDVRETTDYSLRHIPGSVLIPFGQLEDRLEEISDEFPIYIICQSGDRSEKACLLLHEYGFMNVFNVLPGMNNWDGIVESDFM